MGVIYTYLYIFPKHISYTEVKLEFLHLKDFENLIHFKFSEDNTKERPKQNLLEIEITDQTALFFFDWATTSAQIPWCWRKAQSVYHQFLFFQKNALNLVVQFIDILTNLFTDLCLETGRIQLLPLRYHASSAQNVVRDLRYDYFFSAFSTLPINWSSATITTVLLYVLRCQCVKAFRNISHLETKKRL